MKRQIAFLLLTVALAVPSPSVAQISNGDIGHVTYLGASSDSPYAGVYLPFYHFGIADVTGMPGTTYWDFLCVDNLNYIYSTSNYDARFTAVETNELPDLRLTREGSDQIRLGGYTVPSLETALDNYRVAAYLYLQAMDLDPAADQQALADIQMATWYATRSSGYSIAGSALTRYNAAREYVDNEANAFRADGFFVVTRVADEVDDLIMATGGTQEYLVYQSSSVPEPGTVVLLATGLLGVAFVGRRRRKLAELDTEA